MTKSLMACFSMMYIKLLMNQKCQRSGSDFCSNIAIPEDKDIFRGISLFEKLMTCNNPSIDLENDSE